MTRRSWRDPYGSASSPAGALVRPSTTRRSCRTASLRWTSTSASPSALSVGPTSGSLCSPTPVCCGARTSGRKVDTVDSRTWRRLNRPVRTLDLAVVLAGVRRFAEEFHGYLATETMLVVGVNDDEAGVRRVADFVRSLDPSHAYVSVPVRPTTVPWARRPSADAALRAAEAFTRTGLRTTLLSSDEDEAGFAPSPDAIEGLIGILAVHPMTERAARDYITVSGADWQRVEALISEGAIVRVEHDLKPYLRVDHARLGHGRG
jgi:hypothetical protein